MSLSVELEDGRMGSCGVMETAGLNGAGIVGDQGGLEGLHLAMTPDM